MLCLNFGVIIQNAVFVSFHGKGLKTGLFSVISKLIYKSFSVGEGLIPFDRRIGGFEPYLSKKRHFE